MSARQCAASVTKAELLRKHVIRARADFSNGGGNLAEIKLPHVDLDHRTNTWGLGALLQKRGSVMDKMNVQGRVAELGSCWTTGEDQSCSSTPASLLGRPRAPGDVQLCGGREWAPTSRRLLFVVTPSFFIFILCDVIGYCGEC